MAVILQEANASLIDGNNLIKGKLSISDSILLFTLMDGSVKESFPYDIVTASMGKGQTKVKSFFLSKDVDYISIISGGKSSGKYSVKDSNADLLIGAFSTTKINAIDRKKKEEEAAKRLQREQNLKKIETDSKSKTIMDTVEFYPDVIKAKEDYLEGNISEQDLVYLIHESYREEQERVRKAEEKRKRTEEFERQQEIARKEQEERLRAAEEARKAEEERLRVEEEARKAEEERQRIEEEARKAEEERKRQEEAEEERKRKLKEEQQRRAEEERIRREEEARRIEEECARIEAEARAAEEEKLRKEEEERKRKEAAERTRREQVYNVLVEDPKTKDMMEMIANEPRVLQAKADYLDGKITDQNLAYIMHDVHRNMLEEQKRIREEEARKKAEEEAARKAEEERQRAEAERKAEEERLRKEEEERQRAEAERKAEEERLRKEQEEENSRLEELRNNPNTVWVAGKPYANKAEVARAFGIAPATLYNKLKKGWTYEQAVGLEEYVPPKVIYKDKEYDSEQALAESFGVVYTTYKSRLSHGWTQDEALGVVARIAEDKTLSDKTYTLEDVTPAVRHIFDTNPYCVLGISALSTRKDALTVSGKLEKYDKLKILQKYTTPYDLVAMQSPNRELGHVQTTMMNLDKMQYRWLWFSDESIPPVWNRKVFDAFKNSLTYNGMLACIYNCMISDSEYDDKDKWKSLILMLDKLLKMNDEDLYEFIKEHVNEEDRKKYNYHMIVNSFKESVVGIFAINVEKQDADINGKFLIVLKMTSASFKDKLVQKIADSSISWISYETGIIVDTTKRINDIRKGTFRSADAKEVTEIIDAFCDRDGFENVEAIAKSFEGVGIYSEMIREKIRKAVWDATDIINRAGDSKKAAKFDSKIYMYCNDEQKKQLKKIYHVEDMELPDSEFTAEECDKAADRYNTAGKPRKEFEWRLKAAEKGLASAMNEVGVAYATGKGVAKSEKKAVEWYRKGADKGNGCACANLAARFANGSIPGGNEKAKEYYIKAFVHGSMENSGNWLDSHYPGWKKEKIAELDSFTFSFEFILKPVAEAGVVYAQFLMGKKYYEGGFLWETDRNKAKEWLLKAANNGSSDAKAYLKDKFGIDLSNKEFQHIDDTQIYSGNNTKVEFCGIEHTGGKYGLKFWIFNEYSSDRTIWLKNCTVNGTSYGEITKLGAYEPRKGHYGTYFIDTLNPNINSTIKIEVELDDGTTEIATLCRLTVNLNSVTKAVTFSTEALNRYPDTDDDEEVEYELSEDEFDDETIFDDGKIHIEFCGVNLDYSEDCELKFWIRNHYGSNVAIWAKNINVDGEQIKDFKKVGNCNNGQTSWGSLVIPDINPEESYDIELELEVNDSADQTLYNACSLSFTLDGDGTGDFVIHYEDIPNTEDDDDDDAYELDSSEFTDETIYDGNVHIEFCGVNLDYSEECELKFWVRNNSGRKIALWAHNITVDGDDVEGFKKIGVFNNGQSQYGSITLSDINPELYYDFELTIEVDDENDNALYDACSLSFTLEGDGNSNFDINYEKLGGPSTTTTTTSTSSSGSSNNRLYCPGSRYERNYAVNGIEIYFASKPAENIRDYLKADGWRWYQSKGCWYTYYSESNLHTAKAITGEL